MPNARAAANEVTACEEGNESCVRVDISGGRSARSGRRRRTTSLIAVEIAYDEATVTVARCQRRRCERSTSAATLPPAIHTPPCSPSFEKRRTQGVALRVGSERTRRYSRRSAALKADAMLVGLNAEVDDLADIDQHGAVGGLDLQPALAALAHGRAQAGQLLVGYADRQDLAALEADGGATGGVGGTHGWTSTGVTSSVRTPPAVAGCRNATCDPRMPVRGASSISRRPASRNSRSASPTSSTW